MTSFIITTPKEFSFPQCLHFLKRSPHELLHHVQDEQVEKIIYSNGKTVLISVTADPEQQLIVAVLNRRLTSILQQSITHYMQEWFDLKTNLQPFYKMAANDAVLKSLVRKYSGYRIVSMPDLFESLSWAIIGQQINLTFAYKLKRNFVETFGTKFLWKRKTYYHFPLPETIAALEPAALLELQFSRQKAQYVINVANAFTSGAVSKEKLSLLSFHDAKQALTALKGIGNWTANYALMKTFHYPNAFPLEDAGLHQALRKHLNLQRKPTLQQIEMQFKKYAGWEAYATLYLWRSLSED
ncbi:MAG: DNA-3-methyladenine glycosylase 2 [Chitinophagaceae bacterium]|nr:DNA-3-methyladenine glycosylase 2 [Chitinophagaceae bacterium]